MNGLYAWMAERERIRRVRAAGHPAPWTEDPILANFYFTNVMREYDRVSQFVYREIVSRYLANPNLPLLVGLARHLNHPDPLVHLIKVGAMPLHGTREELEVTRDALERYESRGGRVWTGAYMITATHMRNGAYRSKIDAVVCGTVGEMVDLRLPLTSMQEFTETLATRRCWGGFMAYEVACDLRWARGWLDAAPDTRTWANPGPGALRGLRLLLGLERDPSRADAIELMQMLLHGAAEHVDWGFDWPRPLEMRDIEHSLCEYGKYEVIRAGGKAKRRYPQ